MPPVTIKPDDKAIDAYYGRLKDLKQGLKQTTEGSTRRAFSALLEDTARTRKWKLVEEVTQRRKDHRIRLDGVLYDDYSLPRGYWEAKDRDDDLDTEILRKRANDYPISNIIFEDTERAVLIQDGTRMADIDITNPDDLAALLTRFYNHNIEPFEEFSKAVDYFSGVIPDIGRGLRERIEVAHKDNRAFKTTFADFMELCKTSLNPNISSAAVDEMLIQHLLTERLIRKIFQEDFTRRNVIASKVEEVIDALTRQDFSRSKFQEQLEPFYVAIENAAETLAESYQDKQQFINTVYEKFFQGYSVKVADTHGIVYTPQEIVDFMCAAVEEVLQNEFGKRLGQDGVTVLDPATGTGNFIINLLNRVEPKYRREFYRDHLFANEVMLMPYYIAALNIEHAYYELEGRYEPFEGLCFVDTLDLAKRQQMAFSFMTEENSERVQRQQQADITVIIGNPPYNVGQVNENDNNKNRAYEVIDNRVAETYAKDSSATLNRALYDPYVKFFRWATDRLEGKDGMVCYVSNNSFVDGISFDGMRKHLMGDFHRIYIMDLQGNVRKDSMRDGIPIGEEHTVFGLAAMVGISVAVLVRNSAYNDHKLFYHTVDFRATRQEKFDYLKSVQSPKKVSWQELKPNDKNVWLVSEHETEFEQGISIGSKEGKRARKGEAQAIFKLYCRGVASNGDSYVYNYNQSTLHDVVQKMVQDYQTQFARWTLTPRKDDVDSFLHIDETIHKWIRNTKRHLKRGTQISFDSQQIRCSLYRPFSKRHYFFEQVFNEDIYYFPRIFPTSETEIENRVIITSDIGYRASQFSTLISNLIPELHLTASSDSHQCFPFYVYDEEGGNRRENITDWALKQFRAHYGDDSISKWDIFYYVYGLLHHPDYRERYADNLKRELPRIPFAPQFHPFSKAGKQLAEMHLNYEDGKRYDLAWETGKGTHYRVEKMRPVKKRKSDAGYSVFEAIKYNETLTLSGIPEEAFAYRLGNRSALDWIIDQYQVKTDKRSGITSDPNGYSEDDQYIVKLVERIVQLSVDTVKIVDELAKLPFRADS